jgi:glutathione S-transferase
MAAASDVPILWQFKPSHFNEKARWALDWKGIRHERRSLLPGFHIPVTQWVSGQRSVPVLKLDGQVVADSTRIVAELERRFPEPPLYPADPSARARALELEEFFDEEIGVHVRRCFFHVALPDPDFVPTLFSAGFSAFSQTAYRLAFPLVRAIMRMDMGVNDGGNARSLARLEAAMDRLEREIQPSGYLVGDAFGVADLTAAALLVPMTAPPEFPYPWPAPPEPVAEFQARFSGRRGFQWARDMYRKHRGRSAGVDV